MKKILSTSLVLMFGLMLAGNANAQARLGLNGQYGMDTETWLAGAELHVPVAVNNFSFVPNAEMYLQDSPTVFSVNADVHYAIGAGYTRSFTPYVGAGLGITRNNDAKETEVGPNLIGGVNFRTGPAMPFLQVKYRAGDMSDFAVGGGLRFGL